MESVSESADTTAHSLFRPSMLQLKKKKEGVQKYQGWETYLRNLNRLDAASGFLCFPLTRSFTIIYFFFTTENVSA